MSSLARTVADADDDWVVLLQGHQIVDHHFWKLAKRYSSSLFSNLTLDTEPKFPWKIEDMKNILKTSELDG